MSELPNDSEFVPASDNFKANFPHRADALSVVYIVRADCWGIELRDRDPLTGSLVRHVVYDEKFALGLEFKQWARRNPEKLLAMAEEVHIYMFRDTASYWKVVIDTASGNVSFFTPPGFLD
jgi:hypothetical protein